MIAAALLFLRSPLGRGIAVALAALALLGGFGALSYRAGANHEKADQAKRVAAAQAHVATVEAKADKITADVGAKAEAQQAQIRTVTRTIIEKVPVYVTAKADAACPVPLGFVQLHDAAAAGVPPVSDSASKPDEPSGFALSDVAQSVAGNYGTCRAEIARLGALQSWVKAQAANK